MFYFNGALPASKSWMNRALIIQHYNPSIQIQGQADAEDVEVLKNALSRFPHEKHFHLGQGGTSLRFFSFLASRYPGEWTIQAHCRLMERPQAELVDLLKQLGVSARLQKSEIIIQSNGWQAVSEINCEGKTSSQFISGLLLNVNDLKFDLNLKIKKPIVSYEYLKLTLHLLKQVGVHYSITDSEFEQGIHIPKNQKLTTQVLKAELDMSSAFSLIAAGAIDGNVEIKNWLADSAQPDHVFIDIFKKMDIQYEAVQNHFKIKKQSHWNGCDVNLDSTPDLFPVLAVLCALGIGPSFLRGASQLKFKESDRMKKTIELLGLAGFKTEVLEDALLIHGRSSVKSKAELFNFNPDQDHRMAMAAGLLKLDGYNIIIETPEVVNKSYPHFWSDIGLQP